MDSAGILRSLAEVLDKNIPNDAIVAGEGFMQILGKFIFIFILTEFQSLGLSQFLFHII